MSLSDPASKADLQELKTELRADLQELEIRLKESETQMFDRLTEFMRGIETSLLTEFHLYAKAQTSRVHAVEIRSGDMEQRVHLIEERLLELEGRIRPKH